MRNTDKQNGSAAAFGVTPGICLRRVFCCPDDLGSEYSNLSILTAMDFNVVKFDKSLVDKLETNSQSRIVMKHAMNICSELPDTHSLAEGIETEQQLELLLQYHCGPNLPQSVTHSWQKAIFRHALGEDETIRAANQSISAPHRQMHRAAAEILTLSETNQNTAYIRFEKEIKPGVAQIKAGFTDVSVRFKDISEKNLRLSRKISVPVVAVTQWAEAQAGYETVPAETP